MGEMIRESGFKRSLADVRINSLARAANPDLNNKNIDKVEPNHESWVYLYRTEHERAGYDEAQILWFFINEKLGNLNPGNLEDHNPQGIINVKRES